LSYSYLLLPFSFFLSIRPPPRSPLFPYTTLFRSTPAGLPLGGVLLRDVRIGAHESFGRITFEFDGGLPGYKVQYVEPGRPPSNRSEEHTSELQSRGHLVCRLLLEKKKKRKNYIKN